MDRGARGTRALPIQALVFVLVVCGACRAQNWVAEWFVDADPGFGHGQQAVIDPTDTSFQMEVSTAGLQPGTHRLGIRVGDPSRAAGYVDHLHWWSATEFRSFQVDSLSTRSSRNLPGSRLTGGEWFLDRDPGVGNGKSFAWTPADSQSIWERIDMSAESRGHRTLGLRLRDSLGRWSATQYRSVVLVEGFSFPIVASSAPLVGAEWFLGRDPGTGRGTGISWTPSDSVSFWQKISAKGLSIGCSSVGVRLRDSVGRWSYAQSRILCVVDGMVQPLLAGSSPLVGAEWFLGTDPGTGRGNPIDWIPTDSVSIWSRIPFAGRTPGCFDLGLRVRDSSGRWSSTASRVVVIKAGSEGVVGDSSSPLVGGEWFVDRDSGVGRGVPFAFGATDSLARTLYLATRGLPPGPHRIGLRVRDAAGRWSASRMSEFVVKISTSARDTTLSLLEDSSLVLRPGSFAWTPGMAGDSLQAVLLTGTPSHGRLWSGSNPLKTGDSLSAADLGSGRIVYRPAPDANGMPLDTVVIAIVVDSMLSNLAGIRLDVVPVNDAPVLDRAMHSDTAWVGESWIFRWVSHDVDGDSLNLVVRSLPNWLAPGKDGRSLQGFPATISAGGGLALLDLALTDGIDTIELFRGNLLVASRPSTSIQRSTKLPKTLPSGVSLTAPVVRSLEGDRRLGDLRRVPAGDPTCRGIRLKTVDGDRARIRIHDKIGVEVIARTIDDLPGGEIWLDWNLRSGSGTVVADGVYVWEVVIENDRSGEVRKEFLLQGVHTE